MRLIPMKVLIVPAALALLAGCASKLERELTDNAPSGMQLEQALDTSLIEFRLAATGETVNLKAYMEREDRNFLLLTFGSKGCAACNRKALHLKNDVIGLHPLYLTEQGKHFEIVGVNTDLEPYAKLQSYLTGFPHIKWSDPAGKVMLDFFMPPGNKFSVPLTVMVSKEGIAWRIMPNDTIPLAEIIAKVERTLGIRDDRPGDGDGGTGTDGEEGGEGEGGGEQGGGETGGDDGDIPATLLAKVGPGRLKGVNATSCASQAVSVDAALGAGDVRFVQVVQGNCGGTCLANLAELQATEVACAAGRSGGKSCSVASLQTGAMLQAECATGIAFQGGAEFYTVFKTFFDWAYKAVDAPTPEDPLRVQIPAVEGPLVLGFNGKGEIVFGKEGALSTGELVLAMTSGRTDAPARGSDFKLYDKARGEFGFADLRRQAKVTVVAADRLSTAIPCGPCEEELKDWSKAGGFLDWCKERPSECQLVVLETRATPDGMSLPQFYDHIVGGGPDPDDGRTPVASLHDRGNYLPLIVDPVSGNSYLERLYDGYMMGTSADLPTGGRVYVFNQEGLVLNRWVTGSSVGGEDEVFEFVKSYLKN